MINKHKINNGVWMMMGILALSFFIIMPSLAHAQTMFTPNEGDISLNILSQLFGDLVDAANGGEKGKYAKAGLWLGAGLDPFQHVLRTFNFCCMFVGGLLAAYAVTLGLVNTAHEGVAFGKELNNPFFWLRTGGGVTFILPFVSGYCLLQVVVMWVVMQSVGMADTTWKAWFGVNDAEIGCSWGDRNSCSDSVEKGNIQDLYALKMPSPQVAEIAYKTFEGYTCVYGLASEQIKSELDNVDANQSVNNTTNLYKNFRNDISQISAEKGTPTMVVAQNGTEIGTNQANYGFNKFGENNTKTEDEVANIREQQRLALAEQNRNKARAAYNTTRNANLNKLDVHVQNLKLNTEYNPSNYSGNTNNKVFRFGVGNIPSASTGKADSFACGYIDFGNAVGSIANQRLYDTARKVQPSNNQMVRKAGNNGNPMVSYNNMLDAQKDRNARNGKIVANDKQKILDIYVQKYKSLHDEIRGLAKSYVTEVNEKLRFPEQIDNRDAANTIDDNKANQIKAELLIKYNDEIRAAYTKFEQELIKEIYDVYMKANNEQYAANRKRNGSSITSLSSNNDFGNYVDFIKVARDNATTDGWVTGGMWYMSMTQSISKLHELTSIRPQISWASTKNSDYTKLFQDKNQLATINKNIVSNMIDNYGLFNEHAKYSTDKTILQASDNSALDTTNSITALGMNIDVTNLFDSNRHPVILLTETGHNLISAAENFMQLNSYWSARQTKMSVTRDGNVAPDPNNPASQAGVMFSYFAGAIMVMGFMMAYYLPALPFLIWIGAVLGWLISVIEAVIIAPLWGAMHLHPEGHKYTGKGQAGYSLLMSLALRPTLMILGLIASLVIVQVFGMFVNYIFAIGMNVSLQPSDAVSSDITPSKLMYILALYGIYMIFMMNMITKMFNIMTTLPDQILKWIGGSNGNLSEYGAIGGDQTYGKLSSLAGSGGNAYATRLKERGQLAGQEDAKAVAMYGQNSKAASYDVGTNVLSNQEAAALSRGEMAGGLARTHAELNQESVPVASSESPLPQTFSGRGRSIGERQRAYDLRQSVYSMGVQAGMNDQEAASYANDLAAIAYNDDKVRNATANWDKRGVMSRDPENAKTALSNAVREAKANPNNAGEVFLSNMTNGYVKNVSNSRAPITANGVNASNTNYEYSKPIIVDDGKLSSKTDMDNLF